MLEIIRDTQPRRRFNGRELAHRLTAISAAAAEHEARINVLTGLIPQVMERTAALSLLEQALAAEVPSARARLGFIVDVATAAMLETATETRL